jgi:hypothetical protein
MPRSLIVVIVACGLMCAATAARAQNASMLVGLRGVEVRAAIHWSDMPAGAVTEASLRTEVELELRRAGVPVLSAPDARVTPGRPVLVLDLVCVRGSVGSSCGYMMALVERVKLERDTTLAQHAMTWTSDVGVLTVGRDGGGGFIREKVSEQARRFANDFLAAIPRD